MDNSFTYDEFKEALIKKLSENLPEGMTIDGPNRVLKNNGEEKDGLTIKAADSSVAPTIYLDDLYSGYKKGQSFEECLSSVVRIANEKGHAFSDVADQLEDIGFVRSHLAVKVVNAAANAEILKDSVYKPIEDLAAMVVITVGTEDERGSIRMTDAFLKKLHMTRDEAIRQALKNNDSENYTVTSIQDTLKQMMGISEDIELPDTPPIYVVTNESKCYGSAFLASKEQLVNIVSFLGQEAYILPSSIHECLVIPVSEAPSLEDLQGMVRTVNETEVSAGEILSNEVYHFSPETKKLTIAGMDKIEEHDESKEHKKSKTH